MSELKYEAPKSVDAAVALLAAGDDSARIFAGGTDLLVQMREEMIAPTLLVDIKKITEIVKNIRNLDIEIVFEDK